MECSRCGFFDEESWKYELLLANITLAKTLPERLKAVEELRLVDREIRKERVESNYVSH